jgi:hypothetical protein
MYASDAATNRGRRKWEKRKSIHVDMLRISSTAHDSIKIQNINIQ